MDVQCERCKTEYEFDDALVSGRGTTVRCTNCGHQFKVRRPDAVEPEQDRWAVQTAAGHELTFLTLRELQRAILAKQVARADVLVHGGAPPRTLGSIAELEPFFDGRTSSRPPSAAPGAADAAPAFPPAPAAPGARDAYVPADAAAALSKRTASWGAAPEPAPPPPPARRKIDTLRPPAHAAAAPPPPLHAALPPPSAMVTASTPYTAAGMPLSQPGAEDPLTLRRPAATPGGPPVRFETSSPLPPPTGVRRVAPASDEDESRGMRSSLPSSTDEIYSVPRRRRVGGWIVAVVLLGAVGVVGWVVAKPYLLARTMTTTVVQLDPRAQGFVSEGERALADGNLDAAQEAFDKASALAERDPRVLLDEARVAAAKADVPWLKLRLLPADASDEMRMTKSQFDDRVTRVRQAADTAVAAAPEDPAALRAKIDALRLIGERDAARSYVAKVISLSSQPETAYVLAALDLSEPEPLWTTVIDRLRLAAAGEGNAGRARAALVYALARSGDATGARAELAKLDALTRPYPLLPNLHAFVDRGPGKAALDGGVAAAVAHVDVSALPQRPAAPAPGAGAAGGAGGGGEPVGEGSGAMAEASKAIKKGDWNRARQIYEALVARNPSDSEALAGIGDCARAQGDSAGAVAAYKRALAVNPSYLPALLGVADTEWASGDRASAQRAYKDIADRFPEGTYPSYVKNRADTSTAAPSPNPVATGAPAPVPAGSADKSSSSGL